MLALAALMLVQSYGVPPIPQWDVDGACGRLTPREAKSCVETEQTSYELLKQEWPQLTDAERERVTASGNQVRSYHYTMAHRLGEGLLQVDAFRRKPQVPHFQR